MKHNSGTAVSSVVVHVLICVDLGCVVNGTYVLYLGGTDADFPCVAKAINMHHIEFACASAISRVDFLCGDFYWKKLWHLDQEPLYKYVSPALREIEIPIPSEPVATQAELSL